MAFKTTPGVYAPANDILGSEDINPTTGLDVNETPIGKGFKTTKGVYVPETEVTRGDVPSSYERILGEGEFHPEFGSRYTQELLHAKQSATGMIGNSMGRFAIEVASTALQTLAYDSDLTLGTDLAENSQQDFGNNLSRFAESMQEWGQEKMPIYVDPYKVGKFDPGSLSWWSENAVSVGSSIGMIAPAMLLAAATGGAAAGVGLSELAGSMAFRGITTALWSRHAENLMEASGVYKQAYEDAKNQGMSDEDAKNVAAFGASNTYKKQWALLAQDIPQYILFNKLGALSKGGSKTIKDVVGKSTPTAIADWFGKSRLATTGGKVGAVAMDMAGEGGEELYQAIVNEQSNLMAQQEAHPNQKIDHSLIDALKNQYDQGDFWTAGFWGAMGAGAMHASMKGLNYKAMEAATKAQVENLQRYSTLVNQAVKEVKVAMDSGDPIKMQEAIPTFIAATRMRGLVQGTAKYDDMMLDALEKGIDPETAKRWKIDEETQNGLKENPELVKQIRDGNARIDQLYKQFTKDARANKKVKDPDAQAQIMTHTQFILESTKANLEKIITRKEAAKAAIKDYEKLSPTGQEKIRLEAQIREEEKLLAHYKKQRDTASEKLGEKEKVQLDIDIEESDLTINQLKKDLKDVIKQHKTEKVLVNGEEISAEDNDVQYAIPEDKVDIFRLEVGREIAANKVIKHFTENLKKLKDGQSPQTIQKENAEELKKELEKQGQTDISGNKINEIANGDIVHFKGEDGGKLLGRVIKIDGDNYTVHPVDPTSLEPLEVDPVVKPKLSLFLDKKEFDQLKVEIAPEVLTESEQNMLGEVDAIVDIGRDEVKNMHPISNISFSHKTNSNRRPKSRNSKFSKFISNKDNDLSLANVIYSIDTSTEASRKEILENTKGVTSVQKAAFDKLLEGKNPLTEEEIETLLTATSKDAFTDIVDSIPITVVVKHKKEVYSGGLYLHESAFPYIKIPKKYLTIPNKEKRDAAIQKFQLEAFDKTRTNRTEIIRELLSHQLNQYGKVSRDAEGRVNRRQLISRALNRSRGVPYVASLELSEKERNKKLTDVLGVPSKDIVIAIGTTDESTPYMADLSTAKGEHIPGTEMSVGSSGSVFAILAGTETLNGEKYALKLNRPFISEEHADILWDAFMLVGRHGDRIHPYAIKFVKEEGEKGEVIDQRVQGLSAGHVIDLLVTNGEQMTNPDNARFQAMYKDPKHAQLMRNRTLYIDREGGKKMLVYGWDDANNQPFFVDFNQKDISYSLMEKAKFVRWMTTNKRYAVYLTSKNMRLNLNGDFLNGRSFRIGLENPIVRKRADENSPLPTYKEFIIDNGLVTTDAVRNEETGSLFRDPVISANLTMDSGSLNKRKFKRVGERATLADVKQTNKPSKKEEPVVVPEPEKKTETTENAPPEAYNAVVEPPDFSDAYNMTPEEQEMLDKKNKEEKETPYKNSFRTKTERTLYVDGVVASEEVTQDVINKISDGIEKLVASGTKLEDAIRLTEAALSNHKWRFVGLGPKTMNKNVISYLKSRFKGDTNNTLRQEFDEGHKPKKESSTEGEKVVGIELGGKTFLLPEESDLTPEERESILQANKAPKSIDEAMGNKKGITKSFVEGTYAQYTKESLAKEIQWAFDFVGIKESEWDKKSRLIDLIWGGRRNFALYGQFSIKLWEAAEVGTVYHEAFHRVTLGYFTKKERDQLHRAARHIYKLPVEKYSDKQVNEFLADKFEIFVLKKGTMKMPGAIQRFFQPLLDFIDTIRRFFTKEGENEVERLFNQIRRGDYRNRKVLTENKDLLKYGEYAKTMIGESWFNSLDTRKDVKDLVKGLAVQLFELNNVKDLDHVAQLKHRPLVDWIRERKFNLDLLSRDAEVSEEVRKEAYRLYELYDEVLGELDLVTGRYENYSTIIKPQIDSFLNSIGIRQKGNRVVGEEYLTDDQTDGGVDSNEVSVTDSVARLGGDYHKEAYERNKKDDARTNIKFMVATLRDNSSFNAETGEIVYTRNNYTGMGIFVDFHKTWSKLFNTIYWINDVDSMIEELKVVAREENYAPFFELARRLEDSSELVKQQFFVTVRSSKEDFANWSAKRDRDGSYTLTKNNSAMKEAYNTVLAVWNEHFWTDERITTIKVDKNAQFHTFFNAKFFQEINEQYAELKSDIVGYTREAAMLNGVAEKKYVADKTIESIEAIIKLLQKFNIEVDEVTVRRLIQNQKGKDLNTDLDRVYSYVSSELKQIFANTASKVGNKAINLTRAAQEEMPIDRKLVSLFKNAVIRNIANEYMLAHPEEVSDTQMGAGKSQFYSFTGTSHIMDTVHNLQHKSGFAAEKATHIGKKHSRILNDIAKSEDRRNAIGLQALSYLAEDNNNDKGRGYIEITELEDYLVKLNAILDIDPEDPYNTLLPLPSIPRKGYRFIKGVRHFKPVMKGYKNGKIIFTQEVLDYFYEDYIDEVEKVVEARRVRGAYLAAKGVEKENLRHQLVQNYHYSGEAHNMNLSEGNAYDLIHYKGFDIDLDKDVFTQKIVDIFNNRVNQELEYATKIKVINKTGDGQYTNGMLDHEYTAAYSSAYDDNVHIGVIGAIADFTLNTMMSVRESEKVFFADPAFFKQSRTTGDVWEDLYKRWFGVGASGSAFAETLEDDPSTTYSVLTLNTQKFKASFYDVLHPIHVKLWVEHLTKNNKKNLTAEQIEKEANRLADMRLSEYKSVDATDGQSWISPTMFKKMLKRSGNFNPDVEAAFNLLVSDEEITPDMEIKLLNIVLNPQKTVYIGDQTEGDLDIFVYDKMSMGVLFNRLVKDTHMQEVYDRLEARGKYKDKSKIDVVNYASVTKIGGRIGYDLYKDKDVRSTVNDLSNVVTQERYWKNLRNQLVTDSKENFTAQAMGTAVFKIASSNIQKAERYGDYASGMELLNALTRSRIATSNMGRHEVDAILGIKNNRISNVNLIRMLRSDAVQAKKSDDFVRSLKVDKKTGRMYLQLDAFPDRRWMYSRLMNLVTSKTIDLVTPGAQLIQSSSYGFRNINYDNSLAFNILEEGAEQTTQMECRVSIRLFKHLIKGYDNLVHDERVAALKDLNIPLLGYRTPTQGQNSIVSLKIATFLPDQAGDTIYLPLEFTALTGSDFDIDKLYIMFHNYTRNEKGKLSKVEFSTDMSSDAVEARYNAKIEELFNIYKKDQTVVSREIYDKLRDKKADPSYLTQEEFDEVISMLHPDNVTDIQNAREEHQRLTAEYDKAEGAETKDRLYEQILDQRSLIDSILEGNILSGDHIFGKRSFNEKRELLMQRGKIGTLQEFSKLSIEDQNTSKANQNRIIDIFHTVIRDKKHYLSTSQPLGGIKNQIVTLANEAEAAENRGKDLNVGVLGSTTPSYQAEVKNKFVTSAKGVGTFALANAHHALTQMAGLKMKSHVQYEERTNDGVVSLDKDLGHDNVYITDWISAMIDAHVDALKDNYISKLNVNNATYTVTALMLRLGYGIDTFKFMVQPVLKEYAKVFFDAGGKLKNDEETDNYTPLADTAFREMWRKYKDKLGYEPDQVVSLKNDGILIPLDQLIKHYSNIENLKFDLDPKNENNDGRNKRQMNILVHFRHILEDADSLNRLVIESRIDTKKVGATPSEQRFTLNKLKEIERSEKFPGLSRLINSDGMYVENGTMLSPLLSNSLLYLRDILQDASVYGTRGFDELFWKMINAIPGSSNMRQSTVNNIVEEMFSAFVGEFFGDPQHGIGMTKKRLDALLLQGESSIFGLKSKMSKRDYKNWAELAKNRLFNLVQIDSKLGIPMETFLRVPPTYMSNKFESDDYVEDYLALFMHPDAEVRQLARALWIYSYYSTGFRHRYRSYLKHTPGSIHKSIKIQGVKKDDFNKMAWRDVSLDQFFYDLINELNSDKGITALEKYWGTINQGVFENNWYSKWWVQHVNKKQMPIKEYSDSNGHTQLVELDVSEDSTFMLGTNHAGKTIFSNYVIVDDVGDYKESRATSLSENVEEESQEQLATVLSTTAKKKKDSIPGFFEFIGVNETTGFPVYRLKARKGFNKKGVIFREYGIRDKESIIQENNLAFPVSEEEIQKIISANILKFTPISVDERMVVEKALVQEYDQVLDDARELMKKEFEARQAKKKTPDEQSQVDAANQTSNDYASSTFEHPINIFVDGSVRPQDDDYGYGAISHFSGKKMILSGTKEDVQRQLNEYGISNILSDQEQFNPSVELIGLISTLKLFENTSEHLTIRQDFIGATSFDELQNYSKDDPMSESWTSKTPHITKLVKEAVAIIKKIESNGGSVRLYYIPRHNNKLGWKNYAVANIEAGKWKTWAAHEANAHVTAMKNGNAEVDRLAKDTVHKDTFSTVVSGLESSKKAGLKPGNERDERDSKDDEEVNKNCRVNG